MVHFFNFLLIYHFGFNKKTKKIFYDFLKDKNFGNLSGKIMKKYELIKFN